ncbi:hypothetical protein [Shinella sp.]
MNPLAPTTAGTNHSSTAEFSSVSFDLPRLLRTVPRARGFFL